MRKLFRVAARALGVLWATAEFWARIALAFFVLWPVILFVFVLMGGSALVLGFVPAIVAFGLMIGMPLIFGIVAFFQTGREFLKGIAVLVGIELALGAYCWLVPVESSVELAFGFLLMGAIAFFSAFGRSASMSTLHSASWIAIAVITILFFFVDPKDPSKDTGKEVLAAARNWVADEYRSATAKPLPPTDRITVPLTDGYGTRTMILEPDRYSEMIILPKEERYSRFYVRARVDWKGEPAAYTIRTFTGKEIYVAIGAEVEFPNEDFQLKGTVPHQTVIVTVQRLPRS